MWHRLHTVKGHNSWLCYVYGSQEQFSGSDFTEQSEKYTINVNLEAVTVTDTRNTNSRNSDSNSRNSKLLNTLPSADDNFLKRFFIFSTLWLWNSLYQTREVRVQRITDSGDD